MKRLVLIAALLLLPANSALAAASFTVAPHLGPTVVEYEVISPNCQHFANQKIITLMASGIKMKDIKHEIEHDAAGATYSMVEVSSVYANRFSSSESVVKYYCFPED